MQHNSEFFPCRFVHQSTGRIELAEVIEIANHAAKLDKLVRYLQMARKSLREPKIDTELAYAYAKTVSRMSFIQAAKLLVTSISTSRNHTHLPW
jgi:hypothetical protein